MPPKLFRLTVEQQALSLQRQRNKLQEENQSNRFPNLPLLQRNWLTVSPDHEQIPSDLEIHKYQFKLMTWNVRTCTVLGRELFPNSDCLKASQRDPMILTELMGAKADIICLQEVDRLHQLLPRIQQSGYTYTYFAGKEKKHGCAILYKEEHFAKVDEREFYYDDQRLREEPHSRSDGSYLTRNVALIVALQQKCSSDGDGLLVATTHLFWHPKYSYERARQAAILLRAVKEFQKDLGKESWPCIIAGDFNCTPQEGTYSLLRGEKMTTTQIIDMDGSRVVHVSLDPTITADTEGAINEEGDCDRVITNARLCTLHDGLLTPSELQAVYESLPNVRSAYSEIMKEYQLGRASIYCPSQENMEEKGLFEPNYTAYAHYWKATLDYIFFWDPRKQLRVIGAAEIPPASILEPGLPRKGISASDHISLRIEVVVTSEGTLL